MTEDDAHPGAADPHRVDLDLLPLPVIELTPDAHALQVNAAYLRYTGVDGERVHGTGWFASLSPDRRSALFAALAGQADFTLDLRLLRADGVKSWAECVARWVPERGSFLCTLSDTTEASLAVQAAQAEGQRFRLLADNVPALIAYYQRSDFTCVYANSQYARTFNHDAQSIVGLTFAQVIGEEAARLIQPHVDVMLSERRTVSYVRHLEDRGRWMEVSLLPHQIGNGTVVGCFVLISDITRHRQSEIAARESEERLSKFMDASLEGIAFHRNGIITDVNGPMAAMIGSTPERLRGRFVLDFVAPEHLPRARLHMADGTPEPYEGALIDASGQRVAVEFIVRRVQRAGEELNLVVVRDVGDRVAARARIHQLAMHDGLTGLANRSAFMAELDAALARQRGTGRGLAILFADLDHFKRVNDAFGHLAGDVLLRALAQRMREQLPDEATAGRFGGDEFIALLPGADARAARASAERLRAALSAPVEHQGRSLSVTPTFGVALYPDHATDVGSLLRCADIAVRAGKVAGRDSIAFYEPRMGVALGVEMRLETQLERALMRGEFELMWQPRLRVVDGRLTALQALVRWNHPQQGRMTPAAFAGAAESRHLLQPLAAWALRHALRQQRRWALDGLCDVPMALDLGALHPHGVALCATVGQVLAEEPAAATALLIELDERSLRDDGVAARVWLDRLQALGARVMIDEFGATGVALSQLREQPLAGLKIDPALVGALPDDAGAAAVTRAIVTLAHGLGLTVCAAGVASGEQQRWLAEIGCDELQGSWAEAPMTAAGMVDWLTHRPR